MPPPGYQPKPDVAERRAKVLARRTEHIPYEQIAAELGITSAVARKDYERALEALKLEQDGHARFNVARQLETLDVAERAAWAVLRKDHIHVQHGKIVRHEDGSPVLDDAPVLNAIDRILKISERRARLLGLDAPAKIEVSDATDQAIRDLAAQLAAGVGDVEPAGEGPPAGDPEGSEAGADTA